MSRPINLRSELKDGMRDTIPVIIAAAPFAAVYGAAATAKGMSFFEIVLMSATVYAGASQFVAVDLLATPLPFWTIVLSVFAVNFRHILYSASLARKMPLFSPIQKLIALAFMVDPQWALAEKRVDAGSLTKTYWFGAAGPLFVAWVGCSALGAVFGGLISNPAAVGLDFVLPVYFLSILMSFRTGPNWLPIVGISACAALIAHSTMGPPFHVAAGAFAGILFAVIRGKPATALTKDPEGSADRSLDGGMRG